MVVPLKLKPVDPGKIGNAMAEEKKNEFKLEGDKEILKVTVEAGNAINVIGLSASKRNATPKRRIPNSTC